MSRFNSIFISIILTFSLILSLTGCGAASTPSASPAPSGTELNSPTPTASETAQPLGNWPTVEGLSFKDGKYYYEAGNPYGGEVGKEAGVVRENVFVEGEQVGGICFESEVCRVLLDEALEEIPEGEDKVRVIVPLDVSNYSERVEMSNENFINRNNVPRTLMKIVCSGSVPVVNIIPDVSFLNAGYTYFNNNEVVHRSIINGSAYDSFDPNIAFMNVVIRSDGTEFHEKDEYSDLFYGCQLVVKNPNSIIYLGLAAPGDRGSLTTDSLVKISGVPVFMVAERSETS